MHKEKSLPLNEREKCVSTHDLWRATCEKTAKVSLKVLRDEIHNKSSKQMNALKIIMFS